MITHYAKQTIGGKRLKCPTAAWMEAMLEIETEGEITPAQSEPHAAVMDEQTPALLRKQAA